MELTALCCSQILLILVVAVVIVVEIHVRLGFRIKLNFDPVYNNSDNDRLNKMFLEVSIVRVFKIKNCVI